MTTPSNTPDLSPLSAAWADTMSLTDLTEMLRLNPHETPGQQQNLGQRFWSTPARPADSPLQEVMQVTLSSARMINYVSFDVSIFPLDLTLEYYDEQLRTWLPVLDAASTRSSPLTHSVREARPAIIPSATSVTGHVHPQHSFTGHWKSLDFTTKPFQAKDFRIILTRSTKGTAPTTVLGAPVDYSLAVRDLYLGYRVQSRDDVLPTVPVPATPDQRTTFASTTDILGSAVDYSIRVNRAANLVIDGDGDGAIWRCEPQPVPWAVVNLYVDTRALDGSPQLIDKFLLDPLHDGVRFNLYWSTDEPTAPFTPSDDPVPYPTARTFDGANITGDVLHAGAANKDQIGYVEIDNGPFGFEPGRPWWIGGLLAFKFDHGSQSSATPILDFGEFLIAMTPFGPRVTTAHGDTLLVPTDPMGTGTPFGFVASYDGTNLSLWVRQGTSDYAGQMIVTVPLSKAAMSPKMRFGGFQGSTPSVADFDLTALVVKIDEAADAITAADFLTDYRSHVQGEDVGNALLRYHESFSSPDYREGFLGGTPDRYHSLTWNPVARDYLLRRGYLTMPPTRARYWKFEFCGLVPEQYEVFRPVRRTVRTFMPDMWVPPTNLKALSGSILNLFPGTVASIIESVTVSYRDGAVAAMGTGGTGKGYTATTARVVRSHDVRGAISQKYFVWNYLPMHSGGKIPCFERTGKHQYEEVAVDHINKVGYFVGLRNIQPVRVDYVVNDDTPEYVDSFVDDTNIDPEGNWILEDGFISSGNARYAEVKSVPFRSNRVIRAVQFATQQSDPMQVLPDDDFVDPTHSAWTEVGDATFAPELTTDAVLGTMLRIDRSPQPGSWGQIELTAGTFGGLEDTPFGDLESPMQAASDRGGVTSAPIQMPFGGMVHVAGRVVAPVGLSEPLHVQIYDEVADRILADAEIDVAPNKITEWYASYALGDLQPTSEVFRWGDFGSTQMGPTVTDDFKRTNATSLGVMKSGQPWSAGPSGSLIISSFMAVVSVEGQSNSIDPQAPWGTLEISTGTAGTGASGVVKAFEWEPIFLRTDGQVGYSGGSVLVSGTPSVLTPTGTARSLTTNDIIKIVVLPSRYVPSGQADIAYATRDDVVRPYSFMVYLNGTWVRTISHDHGTRTLRRIVGRVSQQFKSFTWTPAPYGRLRGPVIMRPPRSGYGAFVDAENRKFVDGEGFVWTAEGTWDLATAVETANDVTVAPPVTASVNGSVLAVDTESWYGAMTVYVRNVASTFGTGVKHGNVLCLDYDNGIFVNHAGNVVDRAGTNYGNLFTGGIANSTRVTVQWAKTTLVNPANRSGIDPNVFPDILIAKLNGVFHKAFSHASLATWRGTRRGLAGDLYDPTGGTRPVASNYTLDTSFRSFNWAPDAYHTPNTTGPTWGNVTHEDTASYEEATSLDTPDTPQLSARIVQYGITNDLWYVDTLSMFIDPIVWYFSHDGGYTFFPALDIRNNPNGVLMFPPATLITDNAQVPGKALVWKAVAYAPLCNISHLVIRPWYGGVLSAISHQVGVSGGGPNVMPYDQYTDLRRDARFQVWSKPIPQSWWYQFRTIKPPQPDPTPVGPDQMLSPDMIIEAGSDE